MAAVAAKGRAGRLVGVVAARAAGTRRQDRMVGCVPFLARDRSRPAPRLQARAGPIPGRVALALFARDK